MRQILRAKDLDGYISFLRRLDGLGTNFAIKNDVILCCSKREGDKKVIGRHIVKDPFFIDNDESYFVDVPYVMVSIDTLVKNILNATIIILDDSVIKNKQARSKITLIREPLEYSLEFGTGERVKIAVPITKFQEELDNNPDQEKYLNVKQTLDEINYNSMMVTTFEDYLDVPYGWDNIPESDLIRIRDGEPLVVQKIMGYNIPYCWSRIAKSSFPLSGVVRFGSPIAEFTEYTFIISENNKDTAILRLHSKYKSPANSNVIKIECIHEYVILLCDIDGIGF